MKLKNGVLLDKEDLKILENYWICLVGKKTPSAVDKKTRKYTRITHLILTVPKGMEVDHINGNCLDNRRKNLRIATKSENLRNRNGWRTKKLPKGVYKEPSGYRARIYKHYKCYELGSFKTIKEAVKAYNKAAKEIHGEFHKPSVIKEK